MRSFGIGVGFAGFVIASACGGAPDSPLLGDDGGTTQGDGATTGDGTTNGDSSSNNCDVTKCAVIPDGFHAARLADGNAKCPNDWSSTAVVSAPVAADGTCTCGCNVTQAPSCEGGNILRYADSTTTATCNVQAGTVTASSTCTLINGGIQLYYNHYQVNPPPAQGGACEFDAKTDTSKVTSTANLVCQPPDKCVGAICDGGAVCVAQDGDVACPAGFPTKTLVGKSASAQCGACGGTCTAQTTCNGTLKFFTDAQCTLGEVDQTTSTTCNANPNLNAGPFYYSEFAPAPTTATCGGSPIAPTPTTSLDTPTTVCCH